MTAGSGISSGLEQKEQKKNSSGMRKLHLHTRFTALSGLPPMVTAIDIFFLTLFFFMLSSSFVQVSGIKVDLPRAETTVQADIEKFIVTIAWSASGPQLFFNDRPVNREQLKENLAEVQKQSRSAMIVIRPDRRIPFEPVAEVMSMAEKAQLASFVAVMPPEDTRETEFTKEK